MLTKRSPLRKIKHLASRLHYQSISLCENRSSRSHKPICETVRPGKPVVNIVFLDFIGNDFWIPYRDHLKYKTALTFRYFLNFRVQIKIKNTNIFPKACVLFSFYFEAECECDVPSSSDWTRMALLSPKFARLTEGLNLSPDWMTTQIGCGSWRISAIPLGSEDNEISGLCALYGSR
jgi:hypothetical protein